MSAGWSKRLDIDPLADGQARIEFDIPLGEFARLNLAPDAPQDLASGHVQFSRHQGYVLADLEVRASVPLVCQRCLGIMRAGIDSRSRVALIGAESEADSVPSGLETVLAPERRVSVRELAEEELMLSMPTVALHADPRDCAGARPEIVAVDERPNVHKPFERLGELLKRDR
jgi:uncharacterized metal-binding protein YceD (DUF177 family)